jgi:ectoine hydroxylase-related dioxygenase (phytanoyl-CoA dioxygenase family)
MFFQNSLFHTLCNSYSAYSYIVQMTQLIQCNQKHVYNSYMFRHQGPIIRDLFKTKEHNANS